MIKHAYLILAHHEFGLLERLVSALDDVRNVIFIHYDKKLEILPEIKTQFADLVLVPDRVAVSWGDVSVVAAEYALFACATAYGQYAYYHLLSGVDYPLKSQDEIHSFFQRHQGKEFIGFSSYDTESEIERKVQQYHLFPKSFRSNGSLVNLLKRVLRAVFIRVQYGIGYHRYRDVSFKKGTQWVSVSDAFVRYVLSKKNEVMAMYTHSFCSDEIFLQSLCWASVFKNQVYDLEDEGRSCLRAIGWRDGVLVDWAYKDFTTLMQSDALFARKFNAESLALLDLIEQEIKTSRV